MEKKPTYILYALVILSVVFYSILIKTYISILHTGQSIYSSPKGLLLGLEGIAWCGSIYYIGKLSNKRVISILCRVYGVLGMFGGFITSIISVLRNA